MSVRTLIQWCYYTFGWFGCTKVSLGCKNCYMFALAKRYHQSRNVGPGAPRVLPKYFQAAIVSMAEGKRRGAPFTWDRECAKLGIRRGVFPSLCDPFDAEVPIDWLLALLDFARVTTNLDWLLLTKRPENWRTRIAAASELASKTGKWQLSTWLANWYNATVIPGNIWIGASVENQECADRRIPMLRTIPATVRFLSCEPLLGPVNLFTAATCGSAINTADVRRPGERWIDWVIVGGESGTGARECDVSWVSNIVAQCKDTNTPVFVKQLGKLPMHHVQRERTNSNFAYSNPPRLERLPLKHKKGGDMAEWPEYLRVRQVPEVRA